MKDKNRLQMLIFSLQTIAKDLKRVCDGLRVCTEIVSEDVKHDGEQFCFDCDDDISVRTGSIRGLREFGGR